MNRRPAPLAAVVLAALSCHGGGDPAIQSVEPRVAARNSPFALEITGTGFGGATTSKDSAPTLFIERTRDLDGNPVPGPSDSGLVRVEVAGGTERISVGLTLLDEAPSGFYGVRVVTRSGGTASFPDAFAVLPVPQVQGLQETAFCLAEGSPASLVFTGTDLPVIGGLGPSATVSNGLAPYDFGAWSAILSSTPSGCRRVPFKRADLRLCDGLAMALPMEAPTGDLSATLSFPAPSDQHVPAPNVAFLVDRPLSLPAFPGGPYAPVDGPADLIVRGKVHAPIEPAPSATIAGSAVATRPEECTASTVPGHRWCSTLAVPIPAGFPVGIHEVVISTMAGCTAKTSAHVVGPPVLDSIAPVVTCASNRNTFIGINGSGFINPRALLQGSEVRLALACPRSEPGSIPPCNQFYIWGGFALSRGPGTYTLSVENGTVPPVRTAATVPLTIAPGPPFVLGPSPGVIYNGVDRKVFLSIEGLTGSIVSAEFVPWSGVGDHVAAKSVTEVDGGAWVEVGAGLAPGWRQVVIHDESPSCPGVSLDNQALDPRTDFVAYSADFETETNPVYVRWDGIFALDAERVPRDTGGTAIHYHTAGADPQWWFSVIYSWPSYDLARARFDLRRSGTGAAVEGPDVRFAAAHFAVEYTLPVPPGDSWTHYDVTLDDPAGWTYRADADGLSRPATAADLRAAIDLGFSFEIRGQKFEADNDASLDNVSLELFH